MSRTATVTFSTTLGLEECCSCHMTFAMPVDFQRQRRRDHKIFTCPNGHQQHYTGPSDEEKLRAQIASLEGDVTAARADRNRARLLAEHAERSARAYKGHLTRIKTRIAAGVCPVAGCRRSGFEKDRILKHLHEKHPAWCADHPEAVD